MTQGHQEHETSSYMVGGLFDTGRDRWPTGSHLWLSEEDPIRLGIFAPQPTRREIASVESGVARFGWIELEYTGYLLFKYGEFPWTDAPFTPHRLIDPFDMHPMPRGTHRSVYTFLVDADTGLIGAMRAFSWPAYFLNHIIESVRRLEAKPYGEPESRAEQSEFYRQYPTGSRLAPLVRSLPAEARCTGGQRSDEPLP